MTIEEKLARTFHALVSTSLGDFFWYALLAGGAWLFFDIVFRAAFRHRRISSRARGPGQVRREVLHSVRSVVIFGLVTGAVIYSACCGETRLYWRVDDYGWGWFVASIGAMILLHDTYFYWTHRLMHHPRLYRLIHHTHHRSISTTPWAAYAFSPAEALLQAGIGPLIVFSIPVHPAAFALFMGWQIAFNVAGHCGYEFMPRSFLRSPVGVFLNSVTHHALHHEKFRANFSLYFNVWDRLMGTNHPDYERRFASVTAAPQPVQAEPATLVSGIERPQ
jgi:sterol desaturase/sphingolipid hydroxylase (fatty acid hydroxylase superfamily)